MFAPCKESYNKSRHRIKKQRHHFADKVTYSRSYGFSSSHLQILELDHKKGWVTKKNWCFQIVVLQKTLENPLDCKEIKPVNPKGNNLEYSLEGLMLKMEFQYFGHLMRRANWLEKTHAGKDWRQEEKGMIEDEMVGWHLQLNGHEFEQTSGGRRTGETGMVQSTE